MNNLGTITSSTSYINTSASAYKTAQSSLIVKQDNIGTPKTATDDSNNDINDTATISEQAMKLYDQDKEQKKQVIVTTITKSDSKTGTTTKTTEVGTTITNTTDTTDPTSTSGTTGTDDATGKNKSKDDTTETTNSNKDLTKEQQQVVEKLKERDTEVKTHEQAHLSAAGGLNASAPTYTYQTGPDGKQYAIGGEVSVSFSKSQNPEDNIKKAEKMKASALAPADPSGQDRSVAQNADAIIASEEQKIKEQKKEKTTEGENTQQNGTTNSTETTGTTAKESNSSQSITA